MSNWIAGDTAPRDGSHILVTQLGGGGFGICGGAWQDWTAVVHYWGFAGEEGFYLSSGASDPIDDRPMTFTHWTPLPPPVDGGSGVPSSVVLAVETSWSTPNAPAGGSA